MGDDRWTTVRESCFPWEREALEYIRERLPDRDPYRAWSNFEFIANDGSINEVDLLVFTPVGFFLVEIKSNPGTLTGDTHTWIWQDDGRRKVADNPIFLANRKAQRLKAWLEHRPALEGNHVPFIEPLIFCSAENLQCELQGNARFHVCLRDQNNRPGIVAALTARNCPGLQEHPRGTFDTPMARRISRAFGPIDDAVLRRKRRIGEYELESANPINDGRGYQDFTGRHCRIVGVLRRVRVYLVPIGINDPQHEAFRRAAEREFRLLDALRHSNILRVTDFVDDDRGPAILFEHSPSEIRLDHFLMTRGSELGDLERLKLMRQVADAIRFAHGKKTIHRALNPRAILIADPDQGNRRALIMNWQLGGRHQGDNRPEVAATVHPEQLMDERVQVFIAPEARTNPNVVNERHDVFSLGAVCYQLATGEPPATSLQEIEGKLRRDGGLDLGKSWETRLPELRRLILDSTRPDPSRRLGTAKEFMERLTTIERGLRAAVAQPAADPRQAQPGDELAGYRVVRQLGTGSTATAFLVERNGHEYVMKVALDEGHNERLRTEGETLQRLHHECIVKYVDTLTLGKLFCLLTEWAGSETLAERLSQGRTLERHLLKDFGEELLDVVRHLEEVGVFHRDIKPHNIGIRSVVAGGRQHLAVFDFSMATTPADQTRVGTPPYLDRFIALRGNPPMWDKHADRFSAAVTLYELATGTLPTWGDGKSDPAVLDCEATIDRERMEADVADAMSDFFERALRRNAAERFASAEDMLQAWRKVFELPSRRAAVSAGGRQPVSTGLSRSRIRPDPVPAGPPPRTGSGVSFEPCLGGPFTFLRRHIDEMRGRADYVLAVREILDGILDGIPREKAKALDPRELLEEFFGFRPLQSAGYPDTDGQRVYQPVGVRRFGPKSLSQPKLKRLIDELDGEDRGHRAGILLHTRTGDTAASLTALFDHMTTDLSGYRAYRVHLHLDAVERVTYASIAALGYRRILSEAAGSSSDDWPAGAPRSLFFFDLSEVRGGDPEDRKARQQEVANELSSLQKTWGASGHRCVVVYRSNMLLNDDDTIRALCTNDVFCRHDFDAHCDIGESWPELTDLIRSLDEDEKGYRSGLILLARTGAGKTVASLKAFFDCVTPVRDSNGTESVPRLAGYLPCWVRLDQPGNNADTDIPSLIHHTLHGAAAGRPSDEWLRYSPPLLLFFDLNAAAGGVRQPVADKLRAFQRDWGREAGHRCVVMYRSTQDDDSTMRSLRQDGIFRAYDCEPLSAQDVGRYWKAIRVLDAVKRKNVGLQPRPHSDDADNRLKEFLDRYADNERLVSTPLLMHFCFMLDPEDIRAIRTPAELYEKVVEKLIERNRKVYPNQLLVFGEAYRDNVLAAMGRAALAMSAQGADALRIDKGRLINALTRPQDGEPGLDGGLAWWPADPFWHTGDDRSYLKGRFEPAAKHGQDQSELGVILEHSLLRLEGDSFGFLHDSFLYYFLAYTLRYHEGPGAPAGLESEWYGKAAARIRSAPSLWLLPAPHLGGMLPAESLRKLTAELLAGEPFDELPALLLGLLRGAGDVATDDEVLGPIVHFLDREEIRLRRDPDRLYQELYNELATTAEGTPVGRWLREVRPPVGPRVLLLRGLPATRPRMEAKRIDDRCGPIESVCFSPDGRYVVNGTAGGPDDRIEQDDVRRWDVRTGRQDGRFPGINCCRVCISPDGRYVAGAEAQSSGPPAVWDATKSPPTDICLEYDSSSVLCSLCFCYCIDGAAKRLIGGDGDGRIHVWDIERGGAPVRILEGHEGPVLCLSPSADGRLVASGSADGTIRIWDVESGTPRHRLVARDRDCATSRHMTPAARVIRGGLKFALYLFAGGEREFVRLFAKDERARGFDPRGMNMGAAMREAYSRVTEEDIDPVVWSVCLAPGDSKVLTGSGDGIIRLWDVPGGKVVRRFVGHQGAVLSLSISSGGRNHRILSASADGTVRLWDFDTAEEVRRFEGHSDQVWSACFSPRDNRYVVSGGRDGTIRLWDAARPAFRAQRSTDALSPLGIRDLGFSPDGRELVTCGEDATVRLWDLETGGERKRFEGHGAAVRTACFLPDGRIVSGSEDGTIRLWDPTTGREDREYRGDANAVRSIAVSDDGMHLLSVSEGGTVRLWDIGTGEAIEEHCWTEAHGAAFLGKQRVWSVFGPVPNEASRRNQDFRASGAGAAMGEFAPALVVGLGLPRSKPGSVWPQGVVTIGQWGFRGIDADFASADGRAWLCGVSWEGKRLTLGRGRVPGVVELFVADQVGPNRTFRVPERDSKLRWEIEGQSDPPIASVCLSPNGDFAAAGTQDGEVWVWSVADESLAGMSWVEGICHVVAFSPCGRFIAAGDASGQWHLWRIEDLAGRAAGAAGAANLTDRARRDDYPI